MNSKIRKQLWTEFGAALESRLPGFVVDDSPTVPRGWRVYKWKWNDDVTVYLTLCILNDADDFTVELAWSGRHRYPSHLNLLIPVDVPESGLKRDRPNNEEFRFRIGYLLPARRDLIWKASKRLGPSDSVDDLIDGSFDLGELPNEVYFDDVLIKASARDSVDKVCVYGIPFLQESLGDKATPVL